MVDEKSSEKVSLQVWWTFRFNEEYATDLQKFIQFLDSDTNYYLFQLEQGALNNYKHYQGYLQLRTKKRKTDLLTLFQNGVGFKPNYLAPLSLPAIKQYKENHHSYFDKTDTRIAGPYEKGVIALYKPSQWNIINFRPFQEDIKNYVLQAKSNIRYVLMVIDPDGNSGKSTIVHYMRLNHNCIYVPPVKCAKDLIQAVCDICISRKLRKVPAFFLDLPRALNKRDMSEFASAMEQLKNGYLYDFRNAYQEWDIEAPHVICFSNQDVDTSLLSKDRWVFKSIDKLGKLIDYVNNAQLDYEFMDPEGAQPADDDYIASDEKIMGQFKFNR